MGDYMDPKDALRAEAAVKWFGYGRWDAPFWFVGMEPGGDDHPEIYTSWAACGKSGLIDTKMHEDEWNRRVAPELRTRWFAERPAIQRGTWQPLIHVVLGYTGSDEDAHAYQRDKLGRADGETALIEASPTAYKSLSTPGDRGVTESRLTTLREKLNESHPALAVFYGKAMKSSMVSSRAVPSTTAAFVGVGRHFARLFRIQLRARQIPTSTGQSSAVAYAQRRIVAPSPLGFDAATATT